jgi:hypothetical protein
MFHNRPPEVGRSVTNSSVANNWGTDITSGTANAYGSWIQIHAGFPYDVYQVYIAMGKNYVAAANRNSYIDIGYGPNNTTVQIVIPKLCGSNSGGIDMGYRYYVLPMYLPKNTPIWARHQCTTASTVINVNITALCGEYIPYMPKIKYYNPLGTLGTTLGVAIVPGNNTEGAWTEMIASTPRNYVGMLITGLFAVDTTMTAVSYTGDVGIGPSGSEQVIIENGFVTTHGTNETACGIAIAYYVDVKANSRIVARVSCSGTPDSSLSTIVYGMETM